MTRPGEGAPSRETRMCTDPGCGWDGLRSQNGVARVCSGQRSSVLVGQQGPGHPAIRGQPESSCSLDPASMCVGVLARVDWSQMAGVQIQLFLFAL